jgi:hypothetical protein
MSSSKLGNGRSRIFANRKLTSYQSRKPWRGCDIIASNHPRNRCESPFLWFK